MERTLIIIKPDAVQRGLTGEILRRFEQRGLRIIGMKFMQISRELAARHYAIHQGKGFYDGLVSYITSSPVVVIALEGTNAVQAARSTIGCAFAACGETGCSAARTEATRMKGREPSASRSRRSA